MKSEKWIAGLALIGFYLVVIDIVISTIAGFIPELFSTWRKA